MANRTLRRTQNGARSDASRIDGNSPTSDSANGGDAGSEPELPIGEPDIDRESNIDGEHDESDTGDTCRIGDVVIDPAELQQRADSAGGGSSGRTRKPRADAGTKRGTRGAKKATATLEPLILMVHTMMASFLHTPELEVDQTEAKVLSDAYCNFCEYHNVPIMSEKRQSEVALFMALGKVYGTRFVAIKERRKREKKNNIRNVTPIKGA